MNSGIIKIRICVLMLLCVTIYSCSHKSDTPKDKSNSFYYKTYVHQPDSIKEPFKPLVNKGWTSFLKVRDSIYLFQVDDLSPETYQWRNEGIFVWDSLSDSWEKLLAFDSEDTLLYSIAHKVEGFYSPQDATLDTIKVLDIFSKNYKVYKYHCDNTISDHSLTIVYFLEDFGGICYYSPYTSTYHFIDTFVNQENYSVSEIKQLMNVVIEDSSFFEYPQPIPPPPMISE